MKVLWLTSIPSPYRVRFFNELGKQCELTVLLERLASSERDDSWSTFHPEAFRAILLKGKSAGVAQAFCPGVVRYLNDSYDHIVVSNATNYTGILAIAYLKSKGIPYEVEGDGAFPGSTAGIKAAMKRFLYSGAEHCFSTGRLHDAYYMRYGAAPSRVVRFPFSSVYEKEVRTEPVSQAQKQILRQALHIRERYVILAVGQFIPRKGFDVLIRAAGLLDEQYGIYIVGGTATAEYERLCAQLPDGRVHFLPFQPPEELGRYYCAADVFVHPTREDIWGLVVNEAMAQGLPVVSTQRCIAAVEMIQQYQNGVITEVDNPEQIAAAIDSCIRARHGMGASACEMARKYTIEQMANRHMEIWKESER